MAINFPSNPTNAQEVTEGNVTYVYNATKGYWESSEVSSGASIDVLADMTALIAVTGMANGDQAFVTGNNNLYIYSGSGWYKVATVQNDAPSAITGVNGTYELAMDGTATTITAVSTDPEGFPLTWSYSTSGLGSIATISNTDNVFTITPSTTEADAGTFTLTINATDGVNGAVSTSTNLTLEFIVNIINSRYTTLLATAVDTSDNNNITDNSSNSHSITVNGDTHAGTFSPYRSGGYSTYFDGTTDYITIPASSNLDVSLSDTTIEGWFYTTSTSVKQCLWEFYSNDNNYVRLFFEGGDGNRLWLSSTSSGTERVSARSSATLSINTWYHIAVTRTHSSGAWATYINGSVDSGASGTESASVSTATWPLDIGRDQVATDRYWNGYIQDFRIVKGTAITPPSGGPTGRLEAVNNTSLLTCHLPYIADGSSSAHSITVNGNVSIKPFSPYDYLEYSATDHGGSVYFDGTGDALRIADNSNIQLGTSAFTIEGWFYCNNTTPTQGIAAKRDASGEYWRWIITGGNLNFRFQSVGGGSFTFNTVPVPANTWCHFAVTRDSNNDVRQFINGISTQNAINSTGNFDISGSTLRVGEYELNTGHFNGFVSDIKIVKNSALYTSDFTPPTAPLSSSGAELHIKGTDASIIDKSQGTNLELVNTTGSTTQVKFADTKSIYTGGNSSAKIRLDESNPIYNLSYGQGDFTIEGWFRPTDNTNNPKLYMDAISASTYWQLYYLSGTGITLRANNTGIYSIETGDSFTENTWHHIALCRAGSNYKVFHNGTEIINVNSTHQIGSNSQKTIGGTDLSSGNNLRGHIQDFRITKGLARYTANFTPPTAPLEG